MRTVYLDESGISANDPCAVVAGVIVHPEKQAKALDDYLRSMVEDYIHPDQREGFAFHATEIYSGKKRFDKQRWPREARWKVLDELVSIPKKFDMPIIMGFVPKGKLRRDYQSLQQRDVDLAAHTISFTIALLTANQFMKRSAQPGEMARITVESSDHARQLIKSTHDFVRDPARVAQLDAETVKHLPLDRIVETVTFSPKASSALQVADAVAFSIMRRLRRGRDSERFYDPLVPFMIVRPNMHVIDKLAPGEWGDELDGSVEPTCDL
jgi:uncharacterized protein DUF3800